MKKFKAVEKIGGEWIIRAKSSPSVLEHGAKCIDSEKSIYEKRFKQKRIYLEQEYDKAISEVLGGENVFILGATGYSSLKSDFLKKYGIKSGAYEAANTSLMTNIIRNLEDSYEGCIVKLVSGASDMGVDKAIADVAKKLNKQLLGFSCPEYMLYVKDDTTPVHISLSKDDYADKFVKSLNLLLCTGGRGHSYKKDLDAIFKWGKHVRFIDLISLVSETGVPSHEKNPDGSLEVINAAKLMPNFLSFASMEFANSNNKVSRDRLLLETQTYTKDICRQFMNPDIMFP